MPSSAHRWNKIDSLTPELRRRAVKKWDRSVRVEQYRMEPAPGTAFGAIGSFHWPAGEHPPDDVFGLSHEALDPIRMSCKCFVLYNRTRELFRVMGTIENVQLALQLLRRTFFQLAARLISNVRLYLLHWPDASAMPTHVKLVQHEPIAIRGGSSFGSLESPCAAGRDLTGLDVLSGEAQTASSHGSLRKAIVQILPKLRYHRGAISMRLTLGTFVAEQFRRLPENGHREVGYKLDEYVDMIGETQFKGNVTEALGDRTLERGAHQRLKAAHDLLTPDNIGFTSIHAVRPVYSATFTFSDPLGDFRYTIDWKDTGVISTRPEHNAIPRGWIRLEAHAKQPRALLEVILTSLSVGSSTAADIADNAATENANAASSWRFGIDTSFPVPQWQVPPDLTSFVDRIHFDSSNAAKYPNHDFVVCADFPSLTSIRQCTSYSYKIAGSDYTLEVMLFQDRNKDRATQSIDAYEPRVSIAVRRPDWEAMFEENKRLVVGQGTHWAVDMETWFPCDSGLNVSGHGDGFMQIMEKLQRVAKVVRSI